MVGHVNLSHSSRAYSTVGPICQLGLRGCYLQLLQERNHAWLYLTVIARSKLGGGEVPRAREMSRNTTTVRDERELPTEKPQRSRGSVLRGGTDGSSHHPNHG